MSHYLELGDYRRCVASNYAALREARPDLPGAAAQFRTRRDELFASHSQSALDEAQKAQFKGLDYYPYDPIYRFVLPVHTDIEPQSREIMLPHDGQLRLERFGRVDFVVESQPVSLYVYWIAAYGGGIFLPFRDLTNQTDTYGGGRYVLDTIKHADLGQQSDELVIDFNFAYNPSCAYNARWVCPLSPPENRLRVAIRAGEKRFADAL